MNVEITSVIISSVIAASVATLSSYLTTRTEIKKMQREYLLHYQAERIVRELLEHKKWKLRTFKAIKYHLGGFEDNELRRILVQVGAIRFNDAQGIEIWGLLSRNKELIDHEYGTKDF